MTFKKFKSKKLIIMSDIKQETFNHKFYLVLLPQEPLLGIKLHNTHAKCEDDEFRPLISIELGFLFLTFSYSHIFWK